MGMAYCVSGSRDNPELISTFMNWKAVSIMARRDGRPEVQHYVPKLLLRNFSYDGSESAFYVFDKHSRKELPGPTSISKICGERRYYEAYFQDERVSIEGPLSEL